MAGVLPAGRYGDRADNRKSHRATAPKAWGWNRGIVRPLTFSIANGIAFGFVTYASVELVAGRWREANPSVLVLR